MIPVSLTIKGIYSYQDKEQTIDFAKLSSSGLFGIFGSVGSGKSTILEAISYALYGETERLNNRDNRSYNMMNLKSDQMLIDFTFINAPDKQQYRFIAKANRNKKKHENVNPIERTALKLVDSEWIPISAKSAEEICNLSYVNFRRTVIIPQGKFQEFLQLGDTDRSKMMKELFHLEKFDLSGKTKFLEEKNDATIQNITGQLAQLDDISDEKIGEIVNQCIETKVVLDTAQRQALSINSEIEALKQIKALVDKVAFEQNALEKLQIEKPAIEKLKKDLQEFSKCTAHFLAPMNKLNDLKSNKSGLIGDIQKLKKQFKDIDEQLIKLEPFFKDLKLRYESREELNKQAADCQKILDTRAVGEEIKKLKIRIENGNVEIVKNQANIEDLERKKLELKDAISKIKLQQPDLTELSKIKSWFVQLNALEKESINLENESLKVKNQLNKYTESFVSFSDKLGIDQPDTKPEELLNLIARNIQKLEIEQEECEIELKHLKIKQGLFSYSEQLLEGEACPVCGSTHHPDKMEASDISGKLIKLEKQTATLKLELKKLLEIEKDLGKNSAEYHLTNERAGETSQKLASCKQSILDFRNSYPFKQQVTETALDKAFVDAEKEKKELEKTEKELVAIEKQLDTELKNKEKYQLELNKIGITLSSKTGNYQTIAGQIDNRIFEEYGKLSKEALEKKIIQLEQDFQKTVKDYHSTEKLILELKPAKDKLFGTIETKEKDLDKLNSDIDNLTEVLTNELNNSGYNSFIEIEQVLKLKYDIDAENQKINNFENRFFSVNDQLNKLKLQIGSQTFDEKAFNEKLKEYQDFNEKLNELHKKLGSLEKEKAKQEQKIVEKNNLIAEYNGLKVRADNIQTLKNLFKGSGFVNYISSVYLQNLVNAANHRFMPLTGQKLRLELTSTNDFIIRDFLNEGKTRSVKTLSGGQTFQASLSLALALADSIQSINKSEDNFFFLDEGFGSLDKASLATVFESLKSLRRENRIVGIISHVEELQQEIDNYLKIENTPELGSLLAPSWV